MQNAVQYKRVVTETELLDIVVYSFKRVLVEIEGLPAEQGVFSSGAKYSICAFD